MRKIILLARFLLVNALLFSPAISLASDQSCGETQMSCECTASDGVTTSSSNDSIADGDACAEECRALGASSYAFYCGSSRTPMDSDDITAVGTSNTTTSKEDAAVPALNVPIPGLDLANSVSLDADGNVKTNMIGLYVNAVFSYGIVLAALFGVLMLTIAGFQYMTAGGDKGAVSKAKDRMQNTIFGLVLLMATYAIAFLIDPRTTYFQPLTLQQVDEIRLDASLAGNEGSGSDSGGSGGGGTSWENLTEPYRTIVETAKENVSCVIPDLISSPTGGMPSQGEHHWKDNGMNFQYTAIHALDWRASWGSEIYAPFEGTVTYQQQTNTSNKCGNRIYLKAKDGSASITICHAKDFTDADGVYEKNRSVAKGDVIGHVGGLCCTGQPVAYSATKCNESGALCTDPTQNQNCACQRITEAGNTTGPHVHITFNNMPSGMLLACLE